MRIKGGWILFHQLGGAVCEPGENEREDSNKERKNNRKMKRSPNKERGWGGDIFYFLLKFYWSQNCFFLGGRKLRLIVSFLCFSLSNMNQTNAITRH